MKAMRPPLPELHRVRRDHVPAPEIGHRDLPGLRPAPLQLGDAVIENSPRGDHRRLPAGPRPELGKPGPRPVVRLALSLRQLADLALHDHLALDAIPREHQAGRRVPGQLPALTRGAVAVEGESGLVMGFQQHRAGPWPALLGDGGQHHRRRLRHARRQRVSHPPGKLRHRLGGYLILGQAMRNRRCRPGRHGSFFP